MTIFSDKSFKIASISDIHLGHRRTLTPDILEGLYDILKDEQEVATWDMLVIPGDLYDLLLFFTNPYFQEIMLFFTTLLKLCKKHDVVIRILEGTPAHDNKQSHTVTMVQNILDIGSDKLEVDLKHVTELSIEYIERFDIHILYVPDEWNPDVIDTYNEAVKLMQDRGLTQVDFCLLHGAFNYQIDASLNPKAHSEELWSKLVKYYIFAGHVHFSSQWKNILVAGSFDRLAHGEEQPKGWITVEIKPTGEHEILFHENKRATIYKTIDVRGKPLEEIISIIDETCKDYPERSHIRLHALESDPINDSLKTIKQRYTYFYFTIKKDERKKKEQQRTLQLVKQRFEAITLDKDNLPRIIQDRLQKLNNPHLDIQAIMQLLDQYL